MLVAAYRMVVQGWTKEEALTEMRQGGYGFSPVWQHLLSYVAKMDVVKLRHEAGLAGGEQQFGDSCSSPTLEGTGFLYRLPSWAW